MSQNDVGKSLCLSGKGVTKIFGIGTKSTTAVDHVDFQFHEGELISIVGESGSGKTTLAKMLLGLISVTEGEILFQGNVITSYSIHYTKLYEVWPLRGVVAPRPAGWSAR